MKKNTLFGLWIFLSSSFWLSCDCKSVSQEEDTGQTGLIESVMNAAGINASTMTTQRSVFKSESGLMKGEAAVAAPIQSSDANSTATVNATALRTPATSEGKLETTVDSHNSNFTETTTTPSSQMTSSENTNVTMTPEHVEMTIAPNNLTSTSENATETPLIPQNVTVSSTTPKVENFPSTTISSVETTTVKEEHENQTEQTTMKLTMINSNETEGQTSSNHTIASGNDYINLWNVPFKIKDAISSLFHTSKNFNAFKSSGETTEFTLKVGVNWLYNSLTLSW